MVFGQQTPRDTEGGGKQADLIGALLEGIPPAPAEAARMLMEVQASLDDRATAFHERMKLALEKADEAVGAFPDCIQALLLRANLKYQNLDYHFAMMDYRRVLELHPLQAVIDPVFARISMDTGDFVTAGKIIDGIFESDPDDTRAITLKAELYEKLERPADAAEMLRKLLVRMEGREAATLSNAIARLYLEADMPESAIEVLRILVDARTQNSESHRLYGDAMSELSSLNDAYDAYRMALHIDPGNLKAHYNLGLLIRDMNQPDKAFAELDIVLSSEPNDPDTLSQIFEIKSDQRDSAAALNYALRYLLSSDDIEDEDPALAYIDSTPAEFTDDDALIYGQYLIKIGDLTRAVELIEPFTANPDVSPPFEVLMALAMFELEKYDDALAWTNKALDCYAEDSEGFVVCNHPFPPDSVEGGDFSDLICLEAEIHLSEGKIDDALEALEDLGEDDSQVQTALRIRGEAAYIRKDFDTALQYFHQALAEHPADVDILASLAATYRVTGKTDAAINYYVRAFINDREDLPTVRNLAQLYLDAGMKTEAAHFLREYQKLEDDIEGIEWAKQKLSELQ